MQDFCHIAKRPSASGFTFLELALVIAIIGAIGAASVAMLSGTVSSSKIAATQSKLKVVQEAIDAYAKRAGRLPCPASLTLADTNANFGIEGATPGTCTGGTPAANFTDSTEGVVEGAVPVVTLGLSSQFAYDGWGKRIVYSVWTKATKTDATFYYGIHTTLPKGISVQDVSGNNRNGSKNKFVYLLMSMGANGHGAHNKQGSRMYAGSTNTSEWQNCNCNASAATSYNATYIDQEQTTSTTVTNNYDDIVFYKNFSNMSSPSESRKKGSMPADEVQEVLSVNRSDNNAFARAIAVGDVNGDGYKDMIVSAVLEDVTFTNSGSVYIVFGTPRGIPDDVDLTITPDAKKFARIKGNATSEHAGTKIYAGDINSDRIDDIVITTVTSVFVVFGKKTFSADAALSTYSDGTNGFEITDIDNSSVFSGAIGDINGDLINDLALGSGSGARVIFGKVSGWSATETFSSLETKRQAFQVTESSSMSLGSNLAIGDFNNDGYGDLIISASDYEISAMRHGRIYVLWGKKANILANSGGITTNEIEASTTTGITFTGQSPDYAGSAGVNIADINGDGMKDLIVGSRFASSVEGEIEIVYGKTSAWSANTTLDYTSGATVFSGTSTEPTIGFSVGDVNNDGYADILISTIPTSGTVYLPKLYLVYGKSSFPSSPYLISDATTIDGINFAKYSTTSAVGTAYPSNIITDINGDGFGDIVLGADISDLDGNTGNDDDNAGVCFILYGGPGLWMGSTLSYTPTYYP